MPEKVAAEASIMALTSPFSWKYLHGYVLFIRSAPDCEFVIISRSTNTPRFFPFFCHFQLMSSQLVAEILVSNSQGHDLVLSTIKFHPISSVPALHVIQCFQQYSCCTASASQLCAISKCHQLPPTFCSKACLKNIVQEQKHTQARLWFWGPGRREHGDPGTFYPSSLCNPTIFLGACTAGVCLRWLPYLFHIAIFFMDLLSINLLNKLIYICYISMPRKQ